MEQIIQTITVPLTQLGPLNGLILHCCIALYCFPHLGQLLECDCFRKRGISLHRYVRLYSVALYFPVTPSRHPLSAPFLIFRSYLHSCCIEMFPVFLLFQVRRLLNFFSIPLAVNIMYMVSKLVNVHLDTIKIEQGIKLSSPEIRSWLINPILSGKGSLGWGMSVLAVFPAFFVVIVIFIESEITALMCYKVSLFLL